MLFKKYEFNMVEVNTFLLYDETGEAALIDCGAFFPEERRCLQKDVEDMGLTLKALLNTHLHFDHVLGNRFIFDTYGLKPMYHPNEDALPNLQIQVQRFGMHLDYEPVTAEKFISEGDEICFGNTVLKALLTPGHSPGSLSFYCENSQCVFTGDALFRRSIGRTDLWGGNEQTLLNSIRTQLLTLPDSTRVLPGHGDASSIAEEKQYNPYII